jgi:hypothetical protein
MSITKLLGAQAHTCTDLGLQVLDNVIMTRWKVLPREQCQGTHHRVLHFTQCPSSSPPFRYSELRRQLHHSELELGRVAQDPTNIDQQTQPGVGVDIETGMAAQLAHLHQRDHLLLPHEPHDL